MAERRILFMEYRVPHYTLADAFRPQPGWGKRQFSTDLIASGIGNVDDAALVQGARETTPNGYELSRVWETGTAGERELFAKPVPFNNNERIAHD